QPVETLFERVKQADPTAAGKIGPHNKRRLIRALEVYELTGQPISAQQVEWNRAGEKKPLMVFLERDRADLYRRIDERVDWMFAHGLVEETKRLFATGLAENPTARAAAGYREV